MRAAWLLLLASCAREQLPWDPSAAPRSNVLVIVLDDIGVDQVAVYGENANPPPTPRLDALAASGMLFRNAWAYPTCTPTRVALVTGQHPARWDAHLWVHPDEDWRLPSSAFTVPDLLRRDPRAQWSNSFVGKWHLTDLTHGDPARHPLDHGWDWYAGSLGNLDKYIGEKDGQADYREWQKDSNGELEWTDTYATTDTIDDAIARLLVLPPPWVLWVSLNAAHVPLTMPPVSLVGLPPSNPTATERFALVVQAMDAEIGRLLDATPEDTTILVIGDNGTTAKLVAEPFPSERGKNTLYEGGLNVPLIVAGPLVARPGSESAALVHALDVFATLGDNAGVDPETLPGTVDGYSLLPHLADPRAEGPEHLFASLATENVSHPKGFCAAVRDARYKLITCHGGSEFLYDLRGRGDDGPDLLQRELSGDEKRAHKRLTKAVVDFEEGL